MRLLTSFYCNQPATQSGNVKVQLQIAAREGAARELHAATGIDVRNHLDRLKPAVLEMNPPVDSMGNKMLKNEHSYRLFYFLQISELDFAASVSPFVCWCSVETVSGEHKKQSHWRRHHLFSTCRKMLRWSPH